MTVDIRLTPLPVDRVAARVVFAKGEHWNPANHHGGAGHDCVFDAPPPHGTGKQFSDMIGRRLGSLECLGIFVGNTHNWWVMRCDCGRYTFRTHKQIVRKWRPNDCCPECAGRRKALP